MRWWGGPGIDSCSPSPRNYRAAECPNDSLSLSLSVSEMRSTHLSLNFRLGSGVIYKLPTHVITGLRKQASTTKCSAPHGCRGLHTHVHSKPPLDDNLLNWMKSSHGPFVYRNFLPSPSLSEDSGMLSRVLNSKELRKPRPLLPGTRFQVDVFFTEFFTNNLPLPPHIESSIFIYPDEMIECYARIEIYRRRRLWEILPSISHWLSHGSWDINNAV